MCGGHAVQLPRVLVAGYVHACCVQLCTWVHELHICGLHPGGGMGICTYTTCTYTRPSQQRKRPNMPTVALRPAMLLRSQQYSVSRYR